MDDTLLGVEIDKNKKLFSGIDENLCHNSFVVHRLLLLLLLVSSFDLKVGKRGRFCQVFGPSPLSSKYYLLAFLAEFTSP